MLPRRIESDRLCDLSRRHHRRHRRHHHRHLACRHERRHRIAILWQRISTKEKKTAINNQQVLTCVFENLSRRVTYTHDANQFVKLLRIKQLIVNAMMIASRLVIVIVDDVLVVLAAAAVVVRVADIEINVIKLIEASFECAVNFVRRNIEPRCITVALNKSMQFINSNKNNAKINNSYCFTTIDLFTFAKAAALAVCAKTKSLSFAASYNGNDEHMQKYNTRKKRRNRKHNIAK